MSSLYDVTVTKVGPEHAELEVTVVHPDAGGVSEGVCFALSLLADPLDAYSFGREERVRNSPLFQEIDLDKYLSEDFIRSNARGFIKSSEIIAEENHPPPYWGDEGYEEFWEGDRSSTATLKIVPTHPGWIAHLREGMSWDTAAYDCGGAKEWTRPTRRPGDKVKEFSDDPMAGMKIREKGPVNGAEVDEFILTTKGAGSYGVKEKLEGDAITQEAVAALIGQPVLVQTPYRLEVGTITKADDNYFQIYHESEGSSGSSGCSYEETEWLGRAWHMDEYWVDDLDV